MQIDISDQQARLIAEALDHYGPHLAVMAADSGESASNHLRREIIECKVLSDIFRELL
jgi:hypothetical protein